MAFGIPESTIEEIKARTDLADLIAGYGIQVKRAGGSYKACCPFHHEKTPSFNIQPAKGFYHCFGCGESGDAIKFVMKYEGLTFVEAAKKLAAAWPEHVDFHIGPEPTDGIWVKMPIADSPLEIWKHLAVKLAFNCLSTGTMAAMGRVAGNWMSWVSISNKKLIDRGIRLLVELGGVSYEEAAQRLFAAEEWVQSQDWTGKEEPCAVQVALERIRRQK